MQIDIFFIPLHSSSVLLVVVDQEFFSDQMDGGFICDCSSLHAKLSVGKILNPTLLSEVFIRVRENLDIEKTRCIGE